MTAWLASIVGIVVVGVIIELLIQGRRMENFIRSIYAFIVLFVIVSPLPKLLKAEWWATQPETMINTDFVDHVTQQSRQFQVNQILQSMGYKNAIITMVDETLYVNLGVTLDASSLSELQKILGNGVVIL